MLGYPETYFGVDRRPSKRDFSTLAAGQPTVCQMEMKSLECLQTCNDESPKSSMSAPACALYTLHCGHSRRSGHPPFTTTAKIYAILIEWAFNWGKGPMESGYYAR